VLNLIPATGGAVTLLGRDITHAEREEMRNARKDLQIVFQDPLASLDPRVTVGDSIAEPLLVFRGDLSRAARDAEVAAMMAKVELDPGLINRYPHELSGGQNQRVGIARAMILKPRLVICDEAVSALDVSIRAQIIDLLIALQAQMGLAMIFISHDLAVVREISHRVLVLYLGRVVEMATREQLYRAPQHPYTKALLSAAPIPDPAIERTRVRVKLVGDPPSPMDPRGALRFLPRAFQLIQTPRSRRPSFGKSHPVIWSRNSTAPRSGLSGEPDERTCGTPDPDRRLPLRRRAVFHERRVSPVGMCHCSRCRKASGTGSNAVLTVRKERFTWLAGEDHRRAFALLSGWSTSFCPTCGCPPRS